MGKGDDVEDDFLLMSYYSHKHYDGLLHDRTIGKRLVVDEFQWKGLESYVKGMWFSRA